LFLIFLSFSGQKRNTVQLSNFKWKTENLEKKPYFIVLKEKEVRKLPYYGPISRRIFAVTSEGDSLSEKELFVQRNEAFTTNLISLLNELTSRKIFEIRYSVGFDGLINIHLDENGQLAGSFFSKSETSLNEFKRKMSII
jgi:hypothetical protein